MSDIQIDAPSHFGSAERVIINLFGILGLPMGFSLLFTPLVLLALPASDRTPAVFLSLASVFVIGGLLPLFFFPVLIGNPYVARIVSKYPAAPRAREGAFLVQAIMNPRLVTGWDAVVEDADDFGWLESDAGEFRFIGDHLKLAVSYENVANVRFQNIGWRGLWLIGNRIRFDFTTPVHQFDGVELAAREGINLITAKIASRKLTHHVKELPIHFD